VSNEPQQLVRRDGSIAPTHGTSRHVEGCACVRCRGFEPGHQLTTTHGAYAVVGITGRAQEITDGLIEAMVAEGTWRPSFAPTVQVCSVLLVRVERAAAAIAQVDDAATEPLGSYVGDVGETIEKLRRDLRGWTNAARGYLAELGLTPAALARIARDSGVGRATRAQAALRELNAHLEQHYAEVER
jgi:hypothetical protein